MKPGSLVVVLPLGDWKKYSDLNNWDIKWLPVNNEKDIHVLRTVNESDDIVYVTFEEGIIGYNHDGSELGINSQFVREVEPALDLVALMAQTEELSLVNI